jgi:hypothetical protein
MSNQSRKVLVLTFVLSLLLASCNRHRDQTRANSHPSLVNSSSANLTLPSSAFTSAAPRLEKTNAVGPERPSPFSSQPAAARPAPPAPARTRAADPLESLSLAKVDTKPFAIPIAPAINVKGRTLSPVLPPPPAIGQSTPDAGQLPPFLGTMCCTATATYEPVRPSGLQRMIHKVPGLRRLNPSSTGGKGFVPPRPIHDIQFVLPADASPALMQKKRMDVKASVDASGRVTRVELLSPRDEDLVTLAAYAANGWRFAPAELNDELVPAKIILHFSFDTTSTAQTALDKSKRQ